ncbi:hypothetical protein QFC21_003793 [Naganishia friedmannii]|uniref:Uncharacterized protein n=1 Tax=Naganishia friedmannii TaxID=89922 RepID=A0ACC2VLN6_9TREE|nr:hypothetical protein QFC21_003793 [Naganishia friedmannii]
MQHLSRPILSRAAYAWARPQRTLFSGLFRKSPTTDPSSAAAASLFHPLESSPVPALRAKAALIKSLAPCPVCLDTAAQQGKPRSHVPKVAFTCPDCGFPTHSSEAHWLADQPAHKEYCARLREVNEDEHDLHSPRVKAEFELPGAQDYESTPSLASWDSFWYTRNFKSVDGEREQRHVSKLLTYPVTMAGVLHRLGPFAAGRTGTGKEGKRLTREGERSMAALHTSLHPPMGATPSASTRNAQIPIRLFILGARAESSLPPHVWDQLGHLFPFTRFELFFVGPQAALPARRVQPADDADSLAAPAPADEENTRHGIYLPPTPRANSETTALGQLHTLETTEYGVPSYTLHTSETIKLTTLRARWEDVCAQFGPFDPYTDVFFAFCPGLGFPSPSAGVSASGGAQGGTRTQADVEWRETLENVLQSKCALFLTGFSPRDVERDVRSLQTPSAVAPATTTTADADADAPLPLPPLEYDTLLEPGPNPFASLKWEAGDFDPRVLVRVNWGVWGIRGKRYEVGQRE